MAPPLQRINMLQSLRLLPNQTKEKQDNYHFPHHLQKPFIELTSHSSYCCILLPPFTAKKLKRKDFTYCTYTS